MAQFLPLLFFKPVSFSSEGKGETGTSNKWEKYLLGNICELESSMSPKHLERICYWSDQCWWKKISPVNFEPWVPVTYCTNKYGKSGDQGVLQSHRSSVQIYNPGQKSYDKFSLLVLLHTHQTQTTLHLPNLSPHPTYNVQLVPVISPEFQNYTGWEGEWETATCF